MQPTMLAGVFMWSAWQPDRKLFFNSFFITEAAADDGGGNVAIDPLALGPGVADEIAALGGVSWIVVTNRDHEREARALAARFGAKIAASVLDAPLLAGPVDRVLADGDTIAGATVVALDGLKTPGEFALHFAHLDAALVGDAVWGAPAGALRLMPDEKLADPARAALSLRKLAALRFEHLLVGDGACVFGGARRALWQMLEKRSDAYVNKINVDEMPWRSWAAPAPFGDEMAEIGDVIGAEKLGYRLTRVPPGRTSCPLHWHGAEEELFVVMSGTVTLVTPRGRTALRAGDYVAFPTRPEHAHKLVNESESPCEVLMVANTDARDVCYYPDSHKVLIESTDLLVRDRPELDYFDGEASASA